MKRSPRWRLFNLSKYLLGVVLAGLVLGLAPSIRAADTGGPAGKIRVLLVHGGHDFKTNQFLALFKANPDITVTVAQHPKAHEWFTPERAAAYDVLVFYDMWQNISDDAKAGLISVIKQGKGLVALHHCLGGYQKWDEYADIIGGRYHLDAWSKNGKEMPGSTYKHDVDFKVHVADPNHPVTRGVQDFAIHDETYGGFEVKPGSQVLLTTDEPTNGRDLAWWKEDGASRVVYLQLGHDHQAYENPNYQRLVRQAIQWVARRSAN